MTDSELQQPTSAGNVPGSIFNRVLTIPFPDSFVYSNCSGISTSLMEIHISFAEAFPSKVDVQPRVGVVMPPEHAAQLALNLLSQLIAYERNFGDIRHPDWRTYKSNLGIIANAPSSSTNLSPESSTE
jgi:hypothetical protein